MLRDIRKPYPTALQYLECHLAQFVSKPGECPDNSTHIFHLLTELRTCLYILKEPNQHRPYTVLTMLTTGPVVGPLNLVVVGVSLMGKHKFANKVISRVIISLA